MHTRYAASLATAGLLLVLTACTSSNHSTPTPDTTPTPSTTVLDKATLTQRCVDAITARAEATETGDVAIDPTPMACEGLSDSAYLDAYMTGLEEANRRAQERFRQGDDTP